MFIKTLIGAVLALALASVSFAGGNYGNYYSGNSASGGWDNSNETHWDSGFNGQFDASAYSNSFSEVSGGSQAGGNGYYGGGNSSTEAYSSNNAWAGVSGLCGCDPLAYSGSESYMNSNSDSYGDADAGSYGAANGDSHAEFSGWVASYENHLEWNFHNDWGTWNVRW